MRLIILSLMLHLLSEPSYGRVANSVWHTGTVSEAFEEAEADGKLLLLYWGAEWCPPCNELKQNVFSKPQFIELMKPFVAVYLDGDTDRAQLWGEQLNASGYPTIMVVDHRGRELLRLSTGVSFEEFQQALGRVLSIRKPLLELISLILAGQGDEDDLRQLGVVDWEQIPEVTLSQSEKLNYLSKLLEIKRTPLEVRVKLIVAYLQGALEGGHITLASLTKYLAEVFQSEKTMLWGRSLIVHHAVSVLGEIHKGPDSLYLPWRNRWLEALDLIRADEAASVSTRLWAVGAKVLVWEMENPNKDFPWAMVSEVRQTAKWVQKVALTPFQRQSTIYDAAFLLRKTGQLLLAKEALTRELKTSRTPWFYYSGLAKVALAENNLDLAYVLSAKARESAEGRATKLQWSVSHLILICKYGKHFGQERVHEAISDYYKTAFTLGDGFLGRNGLRSEKVAGSIKDYISGLSLTGLLKEYKVRCGGDSDINRKKCIKHFESLGI